jgi:hypothetical protein
LPRVSIESSVVNSKSTSASKPGPSLEAPREAGPQIGLGCKNLEELVTHIEIVVPQQGVRSIRVVPGRTVVLVCIGKLRPRVEDIFNAKQHGEILDWLDAQVAIPKSVTAHGALIAG